MVVALNHVCFVSACILLSVYFLRLFSSFLPIAGFYDIVVALNHVCFVSACILLSVYFLRLFSSFVPFSGFYQLQTTESALDQHAVKSSHPCHTTAENREASTRNYVAGMYSF